MKLNDPQIETIEVRTGLKPIPAVHPVTEDLERVFGEHTFYVDKGGLFIWEPLEKPQGPTEDVVVAVKLAAWEDDTRSALAPHEPRLTQVLVELVIPS